MNDDSFFYAPICYDLFGFMQLNAYENRDRLDLQDRRNVTHEFGAAYLIAEGVEPDFSTGR
ncbi:MAG: hypothetical protein P8N76_17725 [Pirellulaceae bacterium]|nr:hypothetical protein [Pirellulaceae bacterium]